MLLIWGLALLSYVPCAPVCVYTFSYLVSSIRRFPVIATFPRQAQLRPAGDRVPAPIFDAAIGRRPALAERKGLWATPPPIRRRRLRRFLASGSCCRRSRPRRCRFLARSPRCRGCGPGRDRRCPQAHRISTAGCCRLMAALLGFFPLEGRHCVVPCRVAVLEQSDA